MGIIKKITGKLIGWRKYYARGEKLYKDVIVLDNKEEIEIIGTKRLEFNYMDELEFWGTDYGNKFTVCSIRILKKYVPPVNPQKKINDFGDAVKKQECKKDG